MDKLQKCAKAFEKLLEIQYRIIIGRKGKTVELVIGFSKLDFHHLMGLGKLKDLRIAKQNRGSVFDEIIIGSTTYETLAKSRYLPQIENRFEPLALIEQLLDDNRLLFIINSVGKQRHLHFYCRTQGHRKIFLSVFLPEREERLHRGTAALYHAL